jgi:hypothetical protein
MYIHRIKENDGNENELNVKRFVAVLEHCDYAYDINLSKPFEEDECQKLRQRRI